MRLRWTAKYADAEPFLSLPRAGRTRVRVSVNCLPVTGRFEGGTVRLRDCLGALTPGRRGLPRRPRAGAPMPVAGWRGHYGQLLDLVGQAAARARDVTAELITHRFTPGSQEVLLGWYPRTRLEMDEAQRTE